MCDSGGTIFGYIKMDEIMVERTGQGYSIQKGHSCKGKRDGPPTEQENRRVVRTGRAVQAGTGCHGGWPATQRA